MLYLYGMLLLPVHPLTVRVLHGELDREDTGR